MKERFIFVLKRMGILIGTFLVYRSICHVIGYSLGCPIYRITGLLCPGCGITRMCSHIMRGDLRGAFYYNRLLFLLLPVFFLLFCKWCYDFIIKGKREISKWSTRVLWVCVILLLAFGVARNTKKFKWMSPMIIDTNY